MNEKNQNDYVRRISNQYVERQPTDLDELRALDKKVKRPAQIFAYVFGSLSSLVLGTGMCLAMKIIGDMMIPGIIIGCVGIALVSINYSIYKAMLKSRKDKYSGKVLEMSNKILNNHNQY